MAYRYRNPASYDCAADYYDDLDRDADRAEGEAQDADDRCSEADDD